MIETVSRNAFHDAFNKSDGYKNNFSYEGLNALFEYMEEYEYSTGEKIEFDVVALCCEYAEYENIEEFWKDYDKEDYPDIEAIEQTTTVIKIDDESFIIQQF